MLSENSIVDTLRNRSAAYGWDFVVAYSREKVNHLMMQQYIEKTSAGDEYLPLDVPSMLGLEFRDIIIGPPLISFENSSIASSRAIVRRKIISGTLIHSDGGQVVRWENITPADDYAFLISVDLEYGSGIVTDSLNVSINFKKGTLLNIEGMNSVPADILEGFRKNLSERDNEYILGTIKGNTAGATIYPKKFIVRTQPAPGASLRNSDSFGDGAVLLFVATNLNESGGSAPLNDYPYLLADGRSAALIMGSHAFFGNVLKNHFDSYIKEASYQYVPPDNNNPARLDFTGGYIESQNIITGKYSGSAGWASVVTHYQSSNSAGVPGRAQLQMNGFSLTIDNGDAAATKLVGKFSALPYDQHFLGKSTIYHMDGTIEEQFTKAYPFSRGGQFEATLSLDGQYTIKFSSVGNLSLEAKPIDNSLLTIISVDPTQIMSREFTTALNDVNLLTLPQINTFYIQHILFPTQEVLSFDKVAIPGDIVMFGNINTNLTNLRITPTETLLAAGKTLQFTANPPANVSWLISPAGYGTISSSGLYTAPSQAAVRAPEMVKVTAKNAQGATTSALVTVVPSSIELSASVLVINQASAQPSYQLRASVVSNSYTTASVNWSLASDSVFGEGTITQNGIYTPPDTYDDGMTFVTVLATLPDGAVASCSLCLVSENTVNEFHISPSYLFAVRPSEEHVLTTRSEDFEASQWGLFPNMGSLTIKPPVQEGDNTVYQVVYKAPDNAERRNQVFVKVTPPGKPKRAGYAIIDNIQNNSIWDEIVSISTLKISGVSANAGTIFGNGLNQFGLAISVEGIDKNDRKIDLPFSEVIKNLELVDYNFGNPLSVNDGWNISSLENEFNGTLPYSLQPKAVTNALFVANTKGPLTQRIAVKVVLTNPNARLKEYSTHANGTPGMDGYVTINVRQRIDYSNPIYLNVVKEELVVLSNNIKTEFVEGEGSNVIRGEDGSVKMANIIITPNESQINTAVSFKRYEFFYHTVRNEDVTDTFQKWNDREEKTFSYLNEAGRQCSVAKKSNPDSTSSHEVITWFPVKNENQLEILNGPVFFKNESRIYRANVQFERMMQPILGAVSFIGLEVSIPDINAYPLGWSSQTNETTLSVYDTYGNNGLIRLNWDEYTNYIIPNFN